MGFSEKFQDDMGLESEPKKWVIAGIHLKPPVKPIYTKPIGKERHDGDHEDHPSTPTGEESKIPAVSKCPPTPRKRKPSLKCNYGSVRQFFKPPDLETVYTRHVERAN